MQTKWRVTGKNIDLNFTTMTDNRYEALMRLEELFPAEQRECLSLRKAPSHEFTENAVFANQEAVKQ